MVELVTLVIALLANSLVPWGLVRLHERWLSPERLARGWPDVTLWAAVITFGPLCLPVHCVRTLGWARGLPLGLLAVVVAALISALGVGAAELGLTALARGAG